MTRNSRQAHLTAQHFRTEKFWTDLHHAPARRRDPRLHANVPVRLSHAKGASVETQSNDLSYHGMQVWCDRSSAAKLRPRSESKEAHPIYAATLQLDIDGISLRVRAHARIAHVTAITDADAPPEHAVAIGMAFVEFEDGAQEALHRFIDLHLQPADW